MNKRDFLSVTCISVFGLACKKKTAGSAKPESIEITDAKLTESSNDEIFLAKRVEAPWGDYGDILLNGMARGGRRAPDRTRVLSLERTGPFVPPISFPGVGNIVVTNAMRQAMESAGFRGIRFQEVRKKLIVESDWHTWNRNAEHPARYPEGGEPEGYVDERKHSESIAEQIGKIWNVVHSPGAELERFKTGPNKYFDVEDRYVPGTWTGADIFSVMINNRCYLSARAGEWFRDYFADWITVSSVAKTTANKAEEPTPNPPSD